MKQFIFCKIAAVPIIVSAFLCSACMNASTQSVQTPNGNLLVQAASPPATADRTMQTSPTPQNRNIVATSANANTSLPETVGKGEVRRVKFARGRNSATFKDVVMQNKDNEYWLEAKAGQTMTISMKVEGSSKSPNPDDDVVFQIYKAGDSEPLAKPLGNSWQGRLPETDEYVIRVISFTDGNGYKLKITIQ